MQGPADETVGAQFNVDRLRGARDKTLTVIRRAAIAMKPGMTEADAKAIVTQVQAELGAPKSWHPPQIRFGRNTVLAFGEKGEENVPLAPVDIFFFDIGPIFDGHEGDVGRAFTLGGDAEMERCCRDAETIWQDVRRRWHDTGESGTELYAFAERQAKARGWDLLLKKANGHRIADFPHAARGRGSIEGLAAHPASDRWILEIQIRHPTREFGAFYEDLLC